MPTVEVDPDELRRLTGREVEEDELVRDLFNLGLELEGRGDDDTLELEFAPDRLDRLSVEGIARSLRYQYGIDRGVYLPTVTDGDWTIAVDPSVPRERPYVSGFVARGVDFSETSLASLIQLQEKLHRTMGRQRRKGAIGIHDLAMLKGTGGVAGSTITYRGVAGDADEFVPLEADEAYTPAGVIADHPTGRRYGHLVEEYAAYPAIYDDIGLFSLPPIVNGRRTEVDTGTTDLLVELTGTDQWTIDRMGAILAYALDARGARLEGVDVAYASETLTRPELSVRTKRVTHERIERVLGIPLDADEVVDLAERAGLDAEAADDGEYTVSIPPYRVDALHPLDLIDDIGRAYGFDNLEPRYPEVGTIGGRTDRTRLERAVRDGLIGMGFQDLLNFHLISTTDNFDRLGVDPGSDTFGGGRPARIAEPYSEEYAIVRTWALPSLFLVLENNTHRRYPQHLAEVGFVAELDATEPTGVAEERSVAAVLAEPTAGFEDAKARLQFLADEHGAEVSTTALDHPTFLDGRAAAIELDGHPCGVIGEVDPRVLERYELEVPVAAFEFRLSSLER